MRIQTSKNPQRQDWKPWPPHWHQEAGAQAGRKVFFITLIPTRKWNGDLSTAGLSVNIACFRMVYALCRYDKRRRKSLLKMVKQFSADKKVVFSFQDLDQHLTRSFSPVFHQLWEMRKNHILALGDLDEIVLYVHFCWISTGSSLNHWNSTIITLAFVCDLSVPAEWKAFYIVTS